MSTPPPRQALAQPSAAGPRFALPIAAAMIAAVLLAAPAPAQRSVIIPGRTLMPDGTLARDQAVVIEGGRIIAIDDASRHAENREAQRFPDHVLSPGLVELGSSIGVRGNQSAGVGPIEPALRAADAVDPHDPAMRLALEHGITAAMVLPDPTRIIAGRAAAFSTHPRTGPLAASVDLLNPDGPAVLSMGPQVLDFSYGPTSRAGAAFELREALRAARLGHGPIAGLLPHEQGIIAICASIEDVDLILTATTEAFGSDDTPSNRLVIVHTPDDPSMVADLAQEGVPFVVGPLTFDTPSVQILSVAALSNAGATVAFANRTPINHPDWLRASAALAVKHGMDAAAARRGITSAPAEIARINAGAIRPGADADLVLFTGDPLLLSSRVDGVFVRGQRVHATRPSADEIGMSEAPFPGGTR